MTSLTLLLILVSVLVGLIPLGTTGNAAFSQAPYLQTQNVENRSPPIVEELREKLRPAKNLILVKEDGQIALNGSPLTVEELPERLRRAKAADPLFRVAVRGDLGTLYSETMTVIDIVDEIGVAAAPYPTRNAIVIQKGGQVILNGTPLSLEELRDKLRRAKLEDRSFKATVHGESGLSSSDVARVMDVFDIVKELDVAIGLATRPTNR
jgi:biopolymer transport protein ExbD